MKVLVYIEGPSDKAALEVLLAPLILKKQEEGIAIEFLILGTGDAKKSVLLKVPQKAANIILNDSTAIVIAMPDLYPKNKGFPHETKEALYAGIRHRFVQDLEKKGVSDDPHYSDRFKVFCFKHDFEVLILAAEAVLKNYLGVSSLPRTWRLPVEDQNHSKFPKSVVEEL
ncbi:DUF4276 family protein [Candidatus Cyanaurora vandensis]|uniref:DUF4276 family protein n=1 Tax=Candidatus Cyanaurora vandensis TaxID=2714958 RepID=UPI00257D70D0|nr:DUF4276 family protein [Candidatus Cyanaurora vandensis]